MRRAAASGQASVRHRAAALLKLLGAEDAAGAPCAPQLSSVGDLMGGMDEPTPAAALQASAQDLLGAFLAHPQLVTDTVGMQNWHILKNMAVDTRWRVSCLAQAI